MFASNNMLNDTRFGFNIGDEIRRKLLGLWNAYVFLNTYAILDKPDLQNFTPDESTLDITDKWLNARTNQFVAAATEAYENHQFYHIIKEFEQMVDDLTNWYIRVNRKRFWKSDDNQDKLNAYHTLYNSLKAIIGVMAPIIPFMTEHIWQNMVVGGFEPNAPQSIFLSDFPVAKQQTNTKVLEQTQIARNVITLAQRLRNESQIKIKQPLKHLFVTANEQEQQAIAQFEEIIKDELNIKQIVFETDANKFNQRYLTVNFKTAGAVLKDKVQTLRQILLDATDEQMQNFVNQYAKGSVEIENLGTLGSELFVLMNKPKQDFIIASENNITLVLDITIDENLMIEGLFRELVRQIQVLRKEADFKIEDRIIVHFETNSESLEKAIEQFKTKIMSEALIQKIQDCAEWEKQSTCTVGGEEIVIKLKRA
jgi:isoleucyl-tRNA synthetase